MPKSRSLTRPSMLDEHVRRLQITMDDEVRVGVGDGVEDVEEEPDARLDAEPCSSQ